VTPDGRSAIAYWASVSGRRLRFSAATLAVHEPGSPPRCWSRLSRPPEPAFAGGALAWRVPEVGFSVDGASQRAAFGLRLVQDPRGTADWECRACPAGMRFGIPGGGAVAGLGYAERITFDFPPWALRIQHLRWGRWIAADGVRSIVWLDWRGADRLTAVFVDGVRDPSGLVQDEEVRTSDGVLAFAARTTLHARTLHDIVGRSKPATRVLPTRWLTMEDRKWLSPATLEGAGVEPVTGWAIHEHVRFP